MSLTRSTGFVVLATLYFAGFNSPRKQKLGWSSHPDLCDVEGHARVIGDRFNNVESITFEAAKQTGDLAKDYDAGRPAMTLDGTVNEKLQRAYLEMGLRRMEVKDGPSPEKVFDFFLTKKVLSELDLKKWRPAP